jgi:hypothetical protein
MKKNPVGNMPELIRLGGLEKDLIEPSFLFIVSSNINPISIERI